MNIKIFSVVLIICFVYGTILAQQNFYSGNFAHTFSIVAMDPETGEMGVAVQSHWFSVGTIVTWGEAGVGVIATQSFVNPSFGPRGLELLKQGKTAQEVPILPPQADTTNGLLLLRGFNPQRLKINN